MTWVLILVIKGALVVGGQFSSEDECFKAGVNSHRDFVCESKGMEK